jgi:hypothetical protein
MEVVEQKVVRVDEGYDQEKSEETTNVVCRADAQRVERVLEFQVESSFQKNQY